MSIQPPRIDWSISLGGILTLGTLIVAIGSSSTRQSTMLDLVNEKTRISEERVREMELDLVVVKQDVSYNKEAIADFRAELKVQAARIKTAGRIVTGPFADIRDVVNAPWPDFKIVPN